MGRLKLQRVYLAGAMDRVKDGGVGWRDAIEPWLESRGVITYNPCNKPIDIGLEDADVRKTINEMKNRGEYDKIRPLYQDIALIDLRCVDIVDFLIINIDLDIHPCGTYEELFLANRSKKPILIRIEQGKKNTPNWLLFRLPHELIFDTWDDLKSYLHKVDCQEEVKHLNRWRFFDIYNKTTKALNTPCLQEQAARFAEEAHEGQFRKYTNEPYIVHPKRVAQKVYLYKNSTLDMLYAAYLHDTIEDCGVSYDTLKDKFCKSVADLVLELTNPSKKFPELVRKDRKSLDVRHLKTISKEAKIIKFFDRIDNLNDIPKTESFLQVYKRESLDVAEALRDADEELYQKLIQMCN